MDSGGEIAHKAAVVAATTTFVGPVPPPEVLRQYKEILPSTVEMIFDMSKEEAAHRHSLQNAQLQKKQEELSAYHSDVKRGQYLAFVVTVVAITGATLCAYFNQSAAACVIAGATLVNLVSVFIGRKSK